MRMTIKTLWPALAAATILLPAHGRAQGQSYLAPQAAAAALANGTVWSAAAPNGRNFKLTLNKDGTGRIRGGLPFPVSIKWAVKGEAVCLTGTMISKCLRFREIPNGLQGYVDDKPDLKLTR